MLPHLHLTTVLALFATFGFTQRADAQAETVTSRPPAPHYSVVHSFNGTDGSQPYAALLLNTDGNLYGSTFNGGGSGTLFKITPRGKLTVLHSFNSSTDGSFPTVALLRGINGALYSLSGPGGTGFGGTFYEVTSRGKFTVLHSLVSGIEGEYSYLGTMAKGSDGNFYGTTRQGEGE